MSIRLLALLAAILLLGACSAKTSKQVPSEDPFVTMENDAPILADTDTLTYDFLAETMPSTEPEPSSALSEADLPELRDEDMNNPAAEALISPPEDTSAIVEPPSTREVKVRPPIEAGPLFWVQIFASGNLKSAEEFALGADSKLDERVRILFLEPYYKVLVGGYAGRNKAVDLRRELVSQGYQGAWIFEK
jgi:hypothetical protein